MRAGPTPDTHVCSIHFNTMVNLKYLKIIKWLVLITHWSKVSKYKQDIQQKIKQAGAELCQAQVMLASPPVGG